MDKPYDLSYVLHHLGEEHLPLNAVSPPIFQSSNFSFDSFDALRAALLAEDSHLLYTRGNNPTVNLVEEKLAALERGERAKLVSSGVSAISAAIMAFVSAGDHIVCIQDCYSWTHTLLAEYLPRFGVQCTFVEGKDPPGFEAAMNARTRLVYLESPTTMIFDLQDVKAVAALAHAHGARVVIDNTWATPVFMNPLELGADIVVHSVSKYLGGHSDLVAGAIIGSDEDVRLIFRREFQQHGTVPDPLAAWLVLRGMRTLQTRMHAHHSNALAVAQFLESHAPVEQVLYPFLPSHPQYALALEQMRGGSGLFSIRLRTRRLDSVRAFVDALGVFKRAVSWGGYESLVFPAAAHFVEEPPADSVSLVRLHIGLENPAILIADLDQALRLAA